MKYFKVNLFIVCVLLSFAAFSQTKKNIPLPPPPTVQNIPLPPPAPPVPPVPRVAKPGMMVQPPPPPPVPPVPPIPSKIPLSTPEV